MKRAFLTLCTMSLALFITTATAQTDDPLTSWNEGAAKQAIIEFVNNVTNESGTQFVPANQRIAVFDNDGTLWSEQPMYFQLAFALDRVKTLASKHPEWKDKQPFKAVRDHYEFEGRMLILERQLERAVTEWEAERRKARFFRE